MNMQWLILVCFGIALVLLFHTYVGYPLIIHLLARWFGNPVRKQDPVQKCSIVIAAYNEADTLPLKLRALLDSDNANWIDQILIGSDGSEDGTESAVEAIGDARVRVIRFPKRKGKPAVLNDLIPRCGNGVVVLTDARQEIAPGAIAALLRNFADPQVGVVSGELIFRTDRSENATVIGMDTYWRYEKWIRRAEGRFRSVPGATGALYAIRCEEFRPIPEEMLLDDVAIPMQIIARGWRCVFEPEAVVYDEPSQLGRAEDVRKRRTIAGNVQLAMRMPEFLWPTCNPIWFEFISHKMLRLLSPYLLILLLISSGAGLAWFGTKPIWLCLFGIATTAQFLFYLLAILGRGRFGAKWRLATAAGMFVRLNGVTCLAWLDACRRRFRVDWQRSTHLG